MKVGDLVRYIPYGHTESTGSVGIIKRINDGEYEVYWSDGEYDNDLIYSELEVVSEGR